MKTESICYQNHRCNAYENLSLNEDGMMPKTSKNKLGEQSYLRL